jgi:hypothetical protein
MAPSFSLDSSGFLAYLKACGEYITLFFCASLLH